MIWIVFGLPLLVLILLVLLVPLVLHKNYMKKFDKYLKNIPGPIPNPYFGNMLDFAVPTYKFLDVLTNYVNKYGSLVKIFDGPQSDWILVTDEKLIEYILSSTKHIDKSVQYELFHNWLGTGLVTSTGLKWKKRRRMLTPAFHFSILEKYLDIFEKVGNIFIKKLEECEGEEKFDVYPLVSLYTLDVICESGMGISVNALIDNKSNYVKSAREMSKILGNRLFSPLDPRLYPLTPDYYREQRYLKVLHSHTDDVIDKRIKEVKKTTEVENESDFGIKNKMAFLDILLKITVDGQSLSRADIREEVDSFMFAGHHTTSAAISFALYLLANNPSVQQKVIEEQQEIFNNSKSAKATVADIQRMKYLELVIKETLRLYPSVPYFGRKVSEEFEWNGILFPKNQHFGIVPYIIHRNPKYFSNPLKFIPERFLEIDGTNPYRYIPFSAGSRNCIGQRFAMMEMKITISKVLRNFQLLPTKPKHEVLPAPDLSLISTNGIYLRLTKRE